MSEMKEYLKKVFPNIDPKLLPSKYQDLGNVLIIRLNPKLEKNKKEIAEKLYEKYGKSIGILKYIDGELRIPKIEVFFGPSETIKKELGCLFYFDVTKVMYSKGNSGEKKRLLKMIPDNSKILDMFSGIGYFSIILAKHKKNTTIYCIEKNLDSYRFLIKNIYLNKINNIFPFFGDNREIIPNLDTKFDHILMGYIPSSVEFLPFALKVSKKGTIIHLHQNLKKEELDKFTKELENKYDLKLVSYNKVKSYAPKVYHWVLDLEVL